MWPVFPKILFRIVTLALSFLLLLDFGARLLPGAEDHPRAISGRWPCWACSAGCRRVYRLAQSTQPSLSFCRPPTSWRGYSLAIPACCSRRGPCCASAAIFTRWMSAYGQDSPWAAPAFFIYGLAQALPGPASSFPSQTINTAFFLRTFGIPVQLLRGWQPWRSPLPWAACCGRSSKRGGFDCACEQGADRGAGRHPGCPTAPRQRGGGAQHPVGGRCA